VRLFQAVISKNIIKYHETSRNVPLKQTSENAFDESMTWRVVANVCLH